MADPLRVDVRQGSEELIDIDLDLQDRHGGLHLIKEARGAVYGLGDELLHEIEVDLILLEVRFICQLQPFRFQKYPLVHLHVLHWSNRML